ncbi:ABC transporter ATP-binding protein [Pusillimonas caeni]|uniref:ABC transporter ATP-binding protein n=1 Tax=Pusillimonas caeni TaxID=1348472 RepID=UPI000E59A933|nr:ABC transporter ATP-binding protein [Pusillimonas caeni]TFL14686.1 ABC transporter ATP-binding protein [Pusillimonas caeni]
MLQLEDIDVKYGQRQALFGLNLHVGEGEFVTLLGANGAGKTTTLRTISGLIKPVRGRIRFYEEDIHGRPPSAIVSRGISHSPEGRKVWPFMSVEDNLLLGGYVHRHKRKLKDELQRIYDLYPRLHERRQQHAGTLSGGEQQMVAIGRALMSNPRMLILDEPSLGLAPIMIDRTMDLIRDIHRSGITVLLVEQNAALALEISDRAYVIETGKLVLEGASAALLKSDYVQQAYLGMGVAVQQD